jgi:hypothetical protein
MLKAGVDYETNHEANYLPKTFPTTSFIQDVANGEREGVDGTNGRTGHIALVKWLEDKGINFKAIRRPPIDPTRDEAKRQKTKEQREKMEKEADAARRKWELDRHNWK